MHAALRLQRQLEREEAEIIMISPVPYMTYQPFLPETAAGSIAPAHVIVPLRRALPKCTIVLGEARRIDHAKKTAVVTTLTTEHEGRSDLEFAYDVLILAPGSVSRALPIPGLAEAGIGFKTVEEAIGLRHHVLKQLDIASSTRDVEIREAALTFVFVGGGFAGVEALGELEDMARYAVRHYHNITPDDMRWVLVEAGDRILPEADEQLGRCTVRELRSRNIDVRLGTRLESCEHHVAVLSDGARFPTRTLVWTAGTAPHPIVEATDLPRTARGHLRATATLRIDGTEDAWTAGDAASVPDITAAPTTSAFPCRQRKADVVGVAGGAAVRRVSAEGGGGRRAGGIDCAPNAQHAVHQAELLADNVIASLRGSEIKEYRHAYAGSVASLGLHKGVAHLYGRKLTGYPAWLMYRAYHLSRVPTVNRKVRVAADWTLAAFFKRETAALGSLANP
ncbi:MAG: FAD-dependent oxidoreductase [Streptomycetaceae bacterium]|nr:FAD-dependent oxidoreductase [Streptomycetaceae bacterium]